MLDPLRIPGASLQPPEVNARIPRPPQAQPAGTEMRSFQDVLADAISEVQQLQNEADTTIQQVVAGEITDVSEAMIAIEKADVSFQTMMTVRNKVMTAYEEIMRMQI